MNRKLERILTSLYGSSTEIHNELEALRESTKSLDSPKTRSTRMKPGISIIIPSYQSVNYLPNLIHSLKEQSLDRDLFEVIIVTNGPNDGSISLIEKTKHEHKTLNIRHLHSSHASAGHARNIGIKVATREYITFVDADDTLEPEFLSSAYSHLHPNTVALAPIYNVDSSGFIDADNALNTKMRRLPSEAKLAQHPWALGFNACKFVWTDLIRQQNYNTELRSGEDLVFFAGLLRYPELKLLFLGENQNSYVRHITDTSISRGDESYDFLVTQRLDCVSALREIEIEPGAGLAGRKSLESAQFGFIIRYLENNPTERDEVLASLAERRIYDFPWQKLNTGKARDLAISYCFSPYSDTAAVVAAKAVRERGRIVDVISNNMSKVRRVDRTTSFLTDHLIDEQIIIDSPPSFAGWEQISEFAKKSCSAAETRSRNKAPYESVYSRALWVGSHVAAALFKLRHPGCAWSAEFSDPLRFDAEGKPRSGDFSRNDVAEQLLRALNIRGLKKLQSNSLFELIELATFYLADELIFTNQNQMDYMLKPYPKDIQELVHQKATVRHHPTPPRDAYKLAEPNYALDSDVYNIGYFGSFYPNRGIGDVVNGLELLPAPLQRKVRLHLFTNKPNETQEQLKDSPVFDIITVNPYLPYMEFLATCDQFDLLVVNDVKRSLSMSINPFLPSKYSDYKGSKAKIWAIVDSDSPMDKLTVDYRSEVLSPLSSAKVIKKALSDWIK